MKHPDELIARARDQARRDIESLRAQARALLADANRMAKRWGFPVENPKRD